jgi:hypothetical protein
MQLKNHIYITYKTLRYGLMTLAVVFPILLFLGGVSRGIVLQNSLSAYYFATAPGLDHPPMRVWFVGLLFAIGICLIIYRGFSNKENMLLNIAGLAAVCVAVFPMSWECAENCPLITIHGCSATLLFLSIAAVSLFSAKDTLHLIDDVEKRDCYRQKYRLIGYVMLATPLIAIIFALFLGDLQKFVFAIESVGIWAFAYYWWTKSQEYAQTDAELLALRGEFFL